MMDPQALLRLLALGLTVAVLPLAWVWLTRRGQRPAQRLAGLTALTLFLTFDLIVFGAFTRLSDSGLGCPDWPGCYGHASPIGAGAPIAQAEAALPDGPVTLTKAWIEMIHRYLAMAVGALCFVMTAASWRLRRDLPHSPWWPTLTLAWVIVQGLFGRYTVTWKLYPVIVTLHLLGGLLLLTLLSLQRESFLARPLALAPVARRAVQAAMLLLFMQIALGGWVSTNYAVLACSGFPSCSGQWWPDADYGNGFTLLRDLGHTAQGTLLPFQALVAIHWIHRLGAFLVVPVLIALGWAMYRSGDAARPWGRLLLLLTALQAATGLSNVVLQWPIVAALLHSGGAAALVWTLTTVLARSRRAGPARSPSTRPAMVGLA